MVKIRLERINMQEEVTVKALVDSRVTGLVISTEFARKQLKKIERLIYIKDMDETFNKEGLIENTMKVNIY